MDGCKDADVAAGADEKEEHVDDGHDEHVEIFVVGRRKNIGDFHLRVQLIEEHRLLLNRRVIQHAGEWRRLLDHRFRRGRARHLIKSFI